MESITTDVVLESNTSKKWPVSCVAKIDTGSKRASIDEELANFLRLKECGETTVTNAMGSQERKLVSLTLYWHDEIYTIEASVIDRSGLSTPLILGLDIISQVDLSES